MKAKFGVSAPAYAWECSFGLCHWAEPDMTMFVTLDKKPTTEAKVVKVRIVKESDYRRLVALAKRRN